MADGGGQHEKGRGPMGGDLFVKLNGVKSFSDDTTGVLGCLLYVFFLGGGGGRGRFCDRHNVPYRLWWMAP